MPTFVLTDVSQDVWAEERTIDAAALGLSEPAAWSVQKRRLRGGRRDGVDLIVVDNGALRFSIVPTRGMGLWKGFYRGSFLGWESPVMDGPVHPSLVELSARGGLGWLDGFDELMARCGLENNGAPFEVETGGEGPTRHVVYGLHGRIANVPASYVAVHVEETAAGEREGGHGHEIVIEGRVDESRLFGPNVRLQTRYITRPGARWLTVRDEVVNLGDRPAEVQLLYHWNFGPPFLEAGSRFVAPSKTIVPRDARAVEGMKDHALYGASEPGFAEQVYFHELHAAPGGATLALLHNRARDQAVALRFRPDQLPAFTLWKNTGGLRDGYVTGLEPGTNYPNPRPFEAERGRVVALPVDGRMVAETTLEVLDGAEEVAAALAEIEGIQRAGGPATVHERPVMPFAPAH